MASRRGTESPIFSTALIKFNLFGSSHQDHKGMSEGLVVSWCEGKESLAMIVSIVFPTTSAVVFGLLSAWHGHMMLSAGLSSPLRSQGTLLKLAVKFRKHRKTGIGKADALGIHIAFLPIHLNCPNSTWPRGRTPCLGRFTWIGVKRYM